MASATPEPEPWDRQASESEPAYAAFCVYRDMGAARTVRDAYRQAKGKAEASQAPGSWLKWVKAHDWEGRVRAWDRRMARVKQQAAEQATRRKAEEWVKRRDEALEIEWRVGKSLLRQAENLAMLPVLTMDRNDNGVVVRVEAVPPGTLRAAAAVAREAAELVRGAAATALGDGEARNVAPIVTPETRAEAERQLEEWRAKMRARIAAAPKGPPE